jgi:hypothetical protein
MSRFRTSWAIFRHSFAVVRQHKTLVIFPMFGMVATLAMIAFYLVPLLFPVTLAETWQGIWNPVEALRKLPAAMERSSAAMEANTVDIDFLNVVLVLAGFYVAALFASMFLNVAFYSQIIQAMNGGRVSVRRGLTVAIERLPAIAAWTLFSGTVGLLFRWFQSLFGIAGQWIAAMLGVSWSVASVFVAPVIINEKKVRNPFHYLTISGSLIKRVWGEGLIGCSGGALVGFLISGVGGILCGVVLIVGMFLGGTAYLPALAIAVVLFALANQCVMTAICKVFHCGLYIYATEGVAPVGFDESELRNAWTVKKRNS